MIIQAMIKDWTYLIIYINVMLMYLFEWLSTRELFWMKIVNECMFDGPQSARTKLIWLVNWMRHYSWVIPRGQQVSVMQIIFNFNFWTKLKNVLILQIALGTFCFTKGQWFCRKIVSSSEESMIACGQIGTETQVLFKYRSKHVQNPHW